MALKPLLQHTQLLETLKSAIDQQKMASTHIISGSPGVGKKLFSLHVIQYLFCEHKNNYQACGECGSCRKIQNTQHEGLHIVEPQGAQIKIEQAREVIRFLSLKSQRQPQAVLILEAHKMNSQTANALLKVIEEPPENSYFFICTSSLSAMLPTIRSRSQIWRLPNLKPETLKTIFPQAEQTLILSAQGRADLLEKSFSESTTELHNKSFSVWSDKFSSVTVLDEFQEELKSREDFITLLSLWQQQIRDACFIKSGRPKNVIFSKHQEHLNVLAQMSYEQLEKLFSHCLDMQQEMNYNVDKSLMLQNFALKVKECQSVTLD